MGLPGGELNWETRRQNMKNVCLNCHEQQWVDNFYVQYDSLIDLYHEKFAVPGLELYRLAKPLLSPCSFPIRWTSPGTKSGITKAAAPVTASR
jgi:hypothetical protein